MHRNISKFMDFVRPLVLGVAVFSSVVGASGFSDCGGIDTAGLPDGNGTHEKNGDVSGVVQDAETTLPVEGAEVWMADETVSTGSSGAFLFEDLNVGSQTLTVQAAGYRPYAGVVQVASGSNALDPIRIDPVACTPDCIGKECGNDGCGGSCGQCEAGERCDQGQHCVPDGCQGNPDCIHLTDACNEGICSMESFACIQQPLAEGADCDDGRSATTRDFCFRGDCLGFGDQVCDDLTGSYLLTSDCIGLGGEEVEIIQTGCLFDLEMGGSPMCTGWMDPGQDRVGLLCGGSLTFACTMPVPDGQTGSFTVACEGDCTFELDPSS